MLKPDGWVIIKVEEGETHYRLFSSWYGGYLDSDMWRLNSGIKTIEKDEDNKGFYIVRGNSSTVYQVHESSYSKISNYNGAVLQKIIEGHNCKVITLEEYFKEVQ